MVGREGLCQPSHNRRGVTDQPVRALLVQPVQALLVQVRPAQVSMFAFGAALKWLSKSQAERFTIACINRNQWHEQAFA